MLKPSDCNYEIVVFSSGAPIHPYQDLAKIAAGRDKYPTVAETRPTSASPSSGMNIYKTGISSDTLEIMLRELRQLRHTQKTEEDFASPSKAAIGMLEEIAEKLRGFAIPKKPAVYADGYGGAQIYWRSGETQITLCASAGGGAATVNHFLVYYSPSTGDQSWDFSTLSEYADKLKELLRTLG